jgi:hypothetical protein
MEPEKLPDYREYSQPGFEPSDEPLNGRRRY